MRAFACQRCGQQVFFDNDVCIRCGSPLAVDPARLQVVVVDDATRRCADTGRAGCNWLTARPGTSCVSCRLTRTRPADDDPAAGNPFRVAEAAKRRLVFQLLTLGISLTPYDETTGTGIAFDLLSPRDAPVTTGHANGVITLDLSESDDIYREQVRVTLREPYRTVLGHFRHEIGHYAFLTIVLEDDRARARALFGDETADYQEALERHYAHGAPADWHERFVSQYATMHPSEDFAETFAHALHIHDMLQTAAAHGVRVDGPRVTGELADPDTFVSLPADLDASRMDRIIEAWLPLSYALNALNRSLGGDDLYPFVLPAPVVDKLAFVHRLLLRQTTPDTWLGHIDAP